MTDPLILQTILCCVSNVGTNVGIGSPGSVCSHVTSLLTTLATQHTGSWVGTDSSKFLPHTKFNLLWTPQLVETGNSLWCTNYM